MTAVPGSPSRDEVLALIASDPPHVHPGAPHGVWAAASDCLKYIADVAQLGARTLETGCGATTIVFAASGANHTSVFLDASEGEAVVSWCAAHGIETGNIAFVPGSSSQSLPQMEIGDLDLVLVDGCHGFPFPQLDWYYSASHLITGGVLIIDDTQLAAPYQLRQYLTADPRWELIRAGSQWAAFRRIGSGSLDEEWESQEFFSPVGLRVEASKRKVRALAGRLKRKLKS